MKIIMDVVSRPLFVKSISSSPRPKRLSLHSPTSHKVHRATGSCLYSQSQIVLHLHCLNFLN